VDVSKNNKISEFFLKLFGFIYVSLNKSKENKELKDLYSICFVVCMCSAAGKRDFIRRFSYYQSF